MERYYAIDFFKFFAALAVVVIHANPFEQVGLLGWDGESIDLVVETLARWAVPFFFMASGFFFGKRVPSGAAKPQYLRKNLTNLAKLYAGWTLFYLLYDLVMMYRDSQMENTSLAPLVSSYFAEEWTLLNVFYLGSPTHAPHLWYLTALFWSLLIVYSFNRYRQLGLLLGLSLVLNVIGVFDLVTHISTRETLFVGLFYTTSGLLIAHHEKQFLTNVSPKLYCLIPVLLLIQVPERLYLFTGDYYLSTIPLVWLIMLFGLRHKRLGRGTLFASVGANSDGIYLIHWLLLKLVLLGLGMMGWEGVREQLLWALLYPPALFFLSYLTFEPLHQSKQKLRKFKKPS